MSKFTFTSSIWNSTSWIDHCVITFSDFQDIVSMNALYQYISIHITFNLFYYILGHHIKISFRSPHQVSRWGNTSTGTSDIGIWQVCTGWLQTPLAQDADLWGRCLSWPWTIISSENCIEEDHGILVSNQPHALTLLTSQIQGSNKTTKWHQYPEYAKKWCVLSAQGLFN